eukprot:15166271-Ditylum_brightwellii.AAC.1
MPPMMGLSISWRILILYHQMEWRQGNFYYVLQNCEKGGQGLIYIKKHELTLDGRESFCEMMEFYEREENLTLIQTNCNTKLSKMRINWNYKGGSSSLLFRMLTLI